MRHLLHTHSSLRLRSPFNAGVLAALAATAVACAQETATQQPAQSSAQTPAKGTVIEGTVPVYTWTPEEDARTVDATNINLRQVFEDIGPLATQWYQHVVSLSNPFFEGRAPGSRGMEVAAEYVEFWLKRAGLKPAFPAAAPGKGTPTTGQWVSYRQQFTLPGGMSRQVAAAVNAAGMELSDGTDFSVLAMSGSADTGPLPVVFAGYAISDGKDGYSSFGPGDDLTGKAVVFFRYEPLDAGGKSRWADKRFSEHSAVLEKLNHLTERGAAAIIMVAPPGAVDGRTALETISTSRWGRRLSIPLVQLSIPAAERLLKAGDPAGKSLLEWRTLADNGTVTCVPLEAGATITLKTTLDSGGTDAENVAGVLPGRGALADQWVVVGAHYDHVGYGYFGTDPSNAGQLHPGADDNASGTATMLMVAQQLNDLYASKDAPADARGVLFIGFTAEESGLRGSRWWVENATIPADKLTMMLNLDMVGRLRSDSLSVYGVGTAEGFTDILRPIFERSGLTVRADPSGRGPSDHASFYAASVPVLFMSTGSHDVYHTPGDYGYTVNPIGGAKIVNLATDLVAAIATRPEPLKFTPSDGTPTADRGYAPVRLGVTPGMDEGDVEAGKRPVGVLVDAVSADTSASDAGIQAGDVLVSWDGDPLEDTRAMMTKLRTHKPGDVVKIVVWRDGKELTIEVTLRAGRPRS